MCAASSSATKFNTGRSSQVHDDEDMTNEMMETMDATVIQGQENIPCDNPESELFFDIETIPDFARSYCFHQQKPEAQDRTPSDLLPNPQDIIRMSISEAKQALLDARPANEWLYELESLEKKTKSRAGFLQMVGSVRSSLAAGENAEANWMKQLSVTPEFCSVIALGWQIGNGPTFSMVVGTDDDTEADLLRQFWSLVRQHSPIVGYNCLRFDIPVMLVRSAVLGVQPSRLINMNRWSNDVIDCYARRYPMGHRSGVEPGGLKPQCKSHGIPVPAGDMDGSRVWDTYQTDKELIHTYVQSDVCVLAQYYSRLKGLFW